MTGVQTCALPICPADVIVRESPVWSLIAPTHHTLAHKTHPTQHEDGQDDADDGADGVRVSLIVL